MVVHLPIRARRIGVEWRTREGGVGIAAATDAKGTPLMGLYTINRLNQPNGWPCLLPRVGLMTDIVIGFENNLAIKIYIDALVTARGVELIVCPPSYIVARGQYVRMHVALWGSEPPERDFYLCAPHFDHEAAYYSLSKSA
jgi:hypothetical protein